MTVTQGPWVHYEYEGTTDEHLEWYREKLTQGLQENPQGGPVVSHYVTTPGQVRTICLTGNGPSSRANAQAIADYPKLADSWDQLSSMCAELRDAFLDAVPEYGDERLNEMVGGPEYVLGYVTEYFQKARGNNAHPAG